MLSEASTWIWKNYKLPIFITENGWGDERPLEHYDPIDDEPRMGYHSVSVRGSVGSADHQPHPFG